MKVGVDAVLLGAWAGKKAGKILEIGTGCGVISLILAQRFPESKILAIDIDKESVKEAERNFETSPWRDNLKANILRFPEDIIDTTKKFDLIVSNPPYFESGILRPDSRREKARHQDSLTVYSLIKYGEHILSEKGRLAIIFPIDFLERIEKDIIETGLILKRICRIRDNESKREKRVMIECSHREDCNEELKEESLTLFEIKEGRREPTLSYQNLCRDLYLKF